MKDKSTFQQQLRAISSLLLQQSTPSSGNSEYASACRHIRQSLQEWAK